MDPEEAAVNVRYLVALVVVSSVIVVPVTTDTFDAEVTLPYVSTVRTGIAVPPPYVAADTPDAAKLTVVVPEVVEALIGAVPLTATILASVYVVLIDEPFQTPVPIVPTVVIANAFTLAKVSSPVFVPDDAPVCVPL
jgi:hypothetical protein